MPVSDRHRRRRRRDAVVAALVWFHRWLGVATCVVFALWFASGAVLLFQPFPSLPRTDQLALEAPIALDAVRVSPARAVAVAGRDAAAVRLVQRGDAPAYVVTSSGATTMVDARTGARLSMLSRAAAERSARLLPGTAARVGAAVEYDQWIVHNRFDPLRPLFRIDAGDAAGTHYYLSARTGEWVQRTDAATRGWNWVGAVLHWAYVTPLRSSFTAWDRTVWWLSFVALLVAVAGTILGIVRTLAARRLARPAFTFYRLRWMRWHHLLGLFAAIFVLSWTLSGWLSMDHGRLFSRGHATAGQQALYDGGMPATDLGAVTPAVLRGMAGAREIDMTLVGGAPVITAWDGRGMLYRFGGTGIPLDDDALVRLAARGVAAAWPGSRWPPPAAVASSDLYALAEGWPASALRFTDPAGTHPDIVIDGADGRLLTVLDPSRKAYAWIYYALHTFNVPGLSDHPWLRRVVVAIPLLLGFVFSITGVMLGWRRARRSFR